MKAVAIAETATIVVVKSDKVCCCQWTNIGWQLFGDKEISKEFSTFIAKNVISKDCQSCSFNEIVLLARLYCAENTGTLEEIGEYIASI